MRPFLLTLWCAAVFSTGLLEADPPDPPSRTLLRTVVEQSLRLADEDDPVRRADACAELADRIAEEVREASVRGDADGALRLGHHLTNVLDRGVAGNFALALEDPRKLGAERQAELEKVGRRADGAGARVEQGLRAFPGQMPPHLKHFADAIPRGFEKASKHPGPGPWAGPGPNPWSKGKDPGFKGKGKDAGFGKDWGFKGKGKDSKKGKGKVKHRDRDGDRPPPFPPPPGRTDLDLRRVAAPAADLRTPADGRQRRA